MENKVDYSKITDSEIVIELLKKREEIEKKIREIDEKALIKYEYECLSINH